MCLIPVAEISSETTQSSSDLATSAAAAGHYAHWIKHEEQDGKA